MIVNEVNVAEFRIKGIKQRKPSLAARLCINSELSGPDEGIIIPNECSRDEAWVITNIKMPESTIEWLERPCSMETHLVLNTFNQWKLKNKKD